MTYPSWFLDHIWTKSYLSDEICRFLIFVSRTSMVNDSVLLNDCIIVAHCFQKPWSCMYKSDIMHGNTSMMELECQLWYCTYIVSVQTIITWKCFHQTKRVSNAVVNHIILRLGPRYHIGNTLITQFERHFWFCKYYYSVSF
jgi:hypothetical protein